MPRRTDPVDHKAVAIAALASLIRRLEEFDPKSTYVTMELRYMTAEALGAKDAVQAIPVKATRARVRNPLGEPTGRVKIA